MYPARNTMLKFNTVINSLLTPSLVATEGWEQAESETLIEVALCYLVSHFKVHVPLEKSGVDYSVVKEEWDDMADYAKQYLSLAKEDYCTIWLKLFNNAA